jgi:hypothetical protein
LAALLLSDTSICGGAEMTNKVINKRPAVWLMVFVLAMVSGQILLKFSENYMLYSALIAGGAFLVFLTYRLACRTGLGVWDSAYYASMWLLISAAVATVSGLAVRLGTFLA